MFQYAFGRAVAARNCTPLKLDLSLLHDHRQGVHSVNRRFGLDIFRLAPDVSFASRSEVAAYHPFGAGVFGKGWFHLRKRFVSSRSTEENGSRFNRAMLEVRAPCYLAGLWQSHLYFKDVEGTIRRDFQFTCDLPERMKELMQEICDQSAVCVHVRRGDYVHVQSAAQTLGFVGVDYYRRAAALAEARVPNIKYFVFSDDIEWCRFNLAFLDRVTFVECKARNGMATEADDMQVMAQGRNFILANSTYSWWSAWLAGQNCQLVIAPKLWFSDRQLSSEDLVLPEWIRV